MLTELKALYSMSRYPLSEPPSYSSSCEQESIMFREKLRENIWDLKLRQINELKNEKANKTKSSAFSCPLTMVNIMNRSLLSTIVGIGVTLIMSYAYTQRIQITQFAAAIIIFNVLANTDLILSYLVDDNDFETTDYTVRTEIEAPNEQTSEMRTSTITLKSQLSES